MIETFTGRLGGGKSFAATKRIADHVCEGHNVYTNMEINLEEMAKYVDRHSDLIFDPKQITLLTEEQIPDFNAHCPQGTPETQVLIVIDEADIWLESRDWNKAGEKKEKDRQLFHYLKQSRKLYTDIIFIVQHEGNLDARIDRMIQYYWRFRDMSKLYIEGLGIRWPSNNFRWTQYDYDGKTLQQTFMVKRDKQIFPLYQTTALLSKVATSGTTAKRNTNKKVKPPLTRKQKMLKYAIIALVCIFPVMLYHLWSVLSDPKTKALYSNHPAEVVHHEPARSDTHEQAPVRVQVAALQAPVPLVRKTVETRGEIFRGYTDGVLRTEDGEYIRGQPCLDGLVLNCTPVAATIRSFDDNHIIYVVCQTEVLHHRLEQRRQQKEQAQATAAATPATALVPPAAAPQPTAVVASLPEQYHPKQPAWMDKFDAGATTSSTPPTSTPRTGGYRPVPGSPGR